MKNFIVGLLVVCPNFVIAQTSGPSTPEVQKFTPASIKNIVNPFSGDLTYTIPILELDGGYPISITYTSGPGMNEEAGSVGLGWQINIGRINRTVRGIPDDFKGDAIIRRMKQKSEITVGIGVGVGAEIFGFKIGGIGGGLSFSNMRGVDIQTNLSVGLGYEFGGAELSGGLTLGMGTNEAASISANAGLRFNDFKIGMNTKISSMEGVQYLGYNATYQKFGNSPVTASFPLITAKNPFTPKINFPVTNTSGSFNFRFGPEIWGMSPGGEVHGQFSVQSYPVTRRVLQGFGYMYLQDKLERNAIMDMGSEKEGPVFQEDKNMYLSYLANDVFSVSAQGLAGTFRPFRKDMGIIHDEDMDVSDFGANLGIETHTAAYYHGGIDVRANSTHSFSGEWKNTPLSNILNFRQSKEVVPIYFKNMGESNGFVNNDLFDKLKGNSPVNFEIGESRLINSLNITAADFIKKQEYSNHTFQYLTAAEADLLGKPLISYKWHIDKNEQDTIQLKRFNDIDGIRKPQHISFITITKDDGSVYEFGIPAYNTEQQEVNFSIDGRPGNLLFNKMTDYDAVNATEQNKSGRTNFFSSTETPAYAYAYLLTAVYSPDYVDLTGNGPTLDDLGTFTKFNYTLETSNYFWQTPTPFSISGHASPVTFTKTAAYNSGNLCDDKDDMASYSSGRKEIWMIHSIETKNYIANIYTSPRSDAAEQTQDPQNQLYKIDAIKLFVRSDYMRNNSTAIPVKSVSFSYDNSLCQGIPAGGFNEERGKLTLKKIEFSYGKSSKERHSFYSFKYNNEKDPQFRYDESAVDRWGSFKMNDPSQPKFNNARFPYSEQDKTKANRYAQAWNLAQIGLPTGGNIEIEYEAKDYAYVQNKPVMQMYKIEGFSPNNFTNPVPDLYKERGNDEWENNEWMIVTLDKEIRTQDQLDKYFKPKERIYINCIVSAGEEAPINKEEATGFFEILEYKPFGNFPSQQVAIHLKLIDDSHPIARSLWQKMRKNLSHILNKAAVDPDKSPMDNIVNVVKSIPKLTVGFMEFFKDYKGKMMRDGRGKNLDADYGSFVRLYKPDGIKFGGGSRVKKILYHDNWDKMTDGNAAAAVYGKEYLYITVKDKDTLSSGIATYEPVGNEENPFFAPTGEFNNANTLAPELYYFKTEPFGESFFPAPSIGYSRVITRDIPDPKITKHGTGYEVDEFYTSKDFPTITNRTGKLGKPAQITGLLLNQKKFTASQGFYIEVNNMHGKQRSHKIYSETDATVPVAGIEYRYKTKDGKLDNQVANINDATGIINTKAQAGIDFDFYITAVESNSIVNSPALHVNLDVIPVVFGIPFPVPVMFPSYAENLVQYKGITTTKLVYRSGLIDEIIAYENGAEISTQNLLYDEKTGAVMLTAIRNEQHKLRYQAVIPAYWYFPKMGPGSLTANYIIPDFATHVVKTSTILNEADKLLLWGKRADPRRNIWVYENSNKEKSLIREDGKNFLANQYYAKIVSVGKKNMLSANAIEITTMKDPRVNNRLKFEQVLDATATGYQQHWQAYYAFRPSSSGYDCACNSNTRFMDSLTNKLRINRDRSLRIDNRVFHRPYMFEVAINGSMITIKQKDSLSNCNYRIKLDKGLDAIKQRCLQDAIIEFDDIEAILPKHCTGITYTASGNYRIVSNCNDGLPGGTATVVQSGQFHFDNNCRIIASCNHLSGVGNREVKCTNGVGEIVNPYVSGILGSWRAKATYKYPATRNYDSLLVADQGFYQNFFLMGIGNIDNRFLTPADKSIWKAGQTAEIYNQDGKSLETLNALGIPGAMVYGYANQFTLASASNAHYYEIASDGFEDYDFNNDLLMGKFSCPRQEHFKFEGLSDGDGKSNIVGNISHTGRRCLMVTNTNPVMIKKKIGGVCSIPFAEVPYPDTNYTLQPCDKIRQFSPSPGKQYILSLWINETRTNSELDESAGMVSIIFFDKSRKRLNKAITLKATGAIIDNWQQANGLFTIPLNTDSIGFELSTTHQEMFVDDIRTHPVDAMMKGYVYDPLKLKIMAVLDEQNYATYFEYDGEGQLSRTKKETEAGIITVSETRTAKPKVEKLEFH